MSEDHFLTQHANRSSGQWDNTDLLALQRYDLEEQSRIMIFNTQRGVIDQKHLQVPAGYLKYLEKGVSQAQVAADDQFGRLESRWQKAEEGTQNHEEDIQATQSDIRSRLNALKNQYVMLEPDEEDWNTTLQEHEKSIIALAERVVTLEQWLGNAHERNNKLLAEGRLMQEIMEEKDRLDGRGDWDYECGPQSAEFLSLAAELDREAGRLLGNRLATSKEKEKRPIFRERPSWKFGGLNPTFRFPVEYMLSGLLKLWEHASIPGKCLSNAGESPIVYSMMIVILMALAVVFFDKFI